MNDLSRLDRPATDRILIVDTESAMVTKIQKWGNSLALRIPRGFARQVRVSEGSEVDLVVERDRLVIRAVRRPRIRLETLLAGITRKNLHAEVDIGGPLGRERF